MEEIKMIAEFMGWTLDDSHLKLYRKRIGGVFKYVHQSQLKYDTDWNCLMLVIKEIGDRTHFELVMGYDHCYWNNEGEQPLGDFEGGYGDIIHIYTAVVSFIKWYNENK